MPRFAANLSLLFTEHAFLDRFAAAADAGFAAVEVQYPYAHPADVVAARAASAGVEVVLFNLPAGDAAANEKGLASLPGREDEFDAGVRTALEYAEALDCPTLHCMAGRPHDRDDPVVRATFVRNVRHAADALGAAGRLLVLEPITEYRIPGYFLPTIRAGLAALDEVDHPNVKLMIDLYHAQLTHGDVTNLVRAVAGRIGHVQVASVPDRAEPDHGELDYPWVLGVVDEVYDGWVGAEYSPAGDTVAGLGWLRAYSG